MFEDGDVAEEVFDLFGAEYDGEFFGNFQAGELFLGPRHVERDGIEEFGGGQEGVDRLRGQLALFDQMQLVITDVVQTELFGTGPEVIGEAFHIMDIAPLSAGGEVAQLHVFEHAAP